MIARRRRPGGLRHVRAFAFRRIAYPVRIASVCAAAAQFGRWNLRDFHQDRIRFLDQLEVMDVDFSDLTFETSADVNECYDFIEAKLADTGRKWFFLVNYRNCHINPDAWFAYAHRGKLLNKESSLGSVRYDADAATKTEMREKAAE